MMPPYMSVKVRQTTTPGTTCPTLYEECVGSLTSHRFITCVRACERGLRLIVLIREDQNVQPFANVVTKAALSSQLFKHSECWSVRGLNLRLPAQQTGSYPTELTGRRSGVTQIISKKPFCPHIWRKGNSLRFACEHLQHSKAGQNQQRTRNDGGEEVKGQGWEARNRSPIPTKSRRCNDVQGFVQRIEGLRENYNNSGGLFGSPGEKFPAEALSIKRGVKLRPIKRWNEGPLLDFTLITKEQRASTG